MLIVELRYPGAWLDGLTREKSWEAQSLLNLMQSALNEAAIALHLFQEVQHPDRYEPRGEDEWEAERLERQLLGQELRAAHRPVLQGSEGWWELEEELRELVDQQVKHRAWHAGRWPRSYEHALPFLHAKSFLYSLDAIAKALEVLAAKPWAPPGVPTAWSAWKANYPDLKQVRDTSHHQEDRALQRGKRGKPLDLKPVDNSLISAPEGGVLVLNSLNGDRYGCTMADGRYGEVDVNDQSLLAAASYLQLVLDAFKWRGPVHHEPS